MTSLTSLTSLLTCKKILNCIKTIIKTIEDITYCLTCKKDTKNINPKVVRTKNDRLAMVPKCSVCGKNTFRFIKQQEARRLLCNLGIKTPLSKVPLLNLLFKFTNE